MQQPTRGVEDDNRVLSRTPSFKPGPRIAWENWALVSFPLVFWDGFAMYSSSTAARNAGRVLF